MSGRALATRLYPIVALVLAGWLLVGGFESYGRTLKGQPWDILLDWNGARVIRMGKNPYQPEGQQVGRGREWITIAGPNLPFNVGHPPTTLVWFLPLAQLDLGAARQVWDELTLLLLFFHLLLIASELSLPSPLATTALLFGLVLSTSWMQDHLGVGQLSEAIAFLYVVAWYHLRRGRDAAAGVALGLACTLKFYPATVVLLLLLSRRWRAVAAAAAAFAAVAVPITWRLGLSSWWLFLEQAKPYTARWLAHISNASLAGILQRVHYPTCLAGDVYRVTWQPGAVVASALSLALIALSWRLGRGVQRRGAAVDLPFALFTTVSMITGPYSWEHYDVTLILPLLVVATALVRARREGLGAGFVALGASATAAVVLMLADDIGTKKALWQQYQGAHKPSHVLLHLHEVANWLPAPTLILLLALLIAWFARRERDGAATAGASAA